MSGKKIIQRKGLRLAKSDVESPRCPCGYHDDMGAKRRVVHLDYLATHFSTAGGLVAHLDEQRKQGNKDYIHYLIADLIMSRYEERVARGESVTSPVHAIKADSDCPVCFLEFDPSDREEDGGFNDEE